MKNFSRLKAGVRLSNTDSGLIAIEVVDYDGGPFELEPKMGEKGIYLASVDRTSSYGLYVHGDVDALDRLAKALATVVRHRRGDTSDE